MSDAARMVHAATPLATLTYPSRVLLNIHQVSVHKALCCGIGCDAQAQLLGTLCCTIC